MLSLTLHLSLDQFWGVAGLHPSKWPQSPQERWRRQPSLVNPRPSFVSREAYLATRAESVATDRDPLHPGAMGAPQETHDEIL